MKKTFLFLLLAVSCTLQAQRSGGQVFLDSLLRELQKSRPDTNKVKLLDQVSFSYARINPAMGLEYANEVEKLSDSLGWKRGIAASHSDRGVVYSVLSDHSRSIYHYRKSLELYDSLGLKDGVAGVLANMSLVYMYQSDYPKALEYAFRALRIDEELHDEKGAATIRENIGTIYVEQKEYDKAMSYYQQALESHRRSGNDFAAARVLGNMGIVFDAKGDYAQALAQHQLALETNRRYGNNKSAQINLANIGVVHCHMNDYAGALVYQMEALRISEDLGMQKDIAVNLGNLGETYYFIATDSLHTIRPDSLVPRGKAANLARAIDYLEQAVAISSKMQFYGGLIEFNQYLSDAYTVAGDFKKALTAYRQHVLYQDSTNMQLNKVKIKNLEVQRELDIKDREIILHDRQLEIARLDAANKRNERVLYITGILVLLIVVGVVVGWLIRRSRAHRTVLSDIANIQSHEIRGPVARIQGLVQLFNREDPADPINGELIGHITNVSVELDEVIKKVIIRIYGKRG